MVIYGVVSEFDLLHRSITIGVGLILVDYGVKVIFDLPHRSITIGVGLSLRRLRCKKLIWIDIP